MPALVHGPHSALSSALVLAHLEPNLAVTKRPLLVFVPFFLVGFGHLRSQGGAGPLRVLLGLR